MASDGLDYWINREKICHLNPFFVLSQNVSSFSFFIFLHFFHCGLQGIDCVCCLLKGKSFSKGMNINNIILAYHKCSCIDIFHSFSLPFLRLKCLLSLLRAHYNGNTWGIMEWTKKRWPFTSRSRLMAGSDNTSGLSLAHQTPNDGALSFAFQFHRRAFKVHTWTAFELYWQ